MLDDIKEPISGFDMPLAKIRSDAILKEIETWATKSITFSFEATGTHLYSMCELRNSYARRYLDISTSIKTLAEKGHIVPSAILGRALIETIGMGCLYLHDIHRLIQAGDLERLDNRFRKYYIGMKGGQNEPIHVMDGIRQIEKIDAKYAKYLDEKFGLISKAFSSLNSSSRIKYQNFSELLSVMKEYDRLSEVAHPNGLGTQYLYPEPDNETESVEKVRAAFRVAGPRAIWYGHHLIKQMEDTQDFPNNYYDKFILQK